MFDWLKRRSAPPAAPVIAPVGPRLEAARAALRAGDDATAAVLLDVLVTEPAPSAETLHLAGVLACRQGAFPRAVTHLRTATTLDPSRAATWFTLAEALVETGEAEAALSAMRAALAADLRYAAAAERIVPLLGALGRYDDAIETYQMHRLLAWTFDPGRNPVALLHAQGRLDDAVAQLEQASARDPGDAAARAYLGATMQARGRLDDAIRWYREALACRSDDAFIHRKLAFALDSRGALDEALVHYERGMALDPADPQAWSDWFSAGLYAGSPPREVRAKAFDDYDHRFRSPPVIDVALPAPGSRRLRVGYVSGDFCDHVINYFFEPVLERHDRSAVEVWCYDRTRQRDAVSLRLEGKADHWRRVPGMAWDALADLVRADGIDILVDLKGHFDDNNLPLFARKPAPVQVTWLGYPDTTGLRSMDAWITDRHIAADLSGQIASERIVPLPHFFMCFRPLPDAPDPGPLPAIATGRVTFGCFNTFAKISPAMREAIIRVMMAVPEARCLMTALPGGDARTALLAYFEGRGIDPARFTLRGRGSHETFLAQHREVDIALDSFPYNGTTTTLHALWMGVPVIALAGDAHVSRVGASILANLGLDDWCGKTVDDYVEIARRCAGDMAALATLRGSLRQRLAGSVIMDETRFVQYLEEAYRAMAMPAGATVPTGSSSALRAAPPDPSSLSR
jgi:protein O-GlcNAc transferase